MKDNYGILEVFLTKLETVTILASTKAPNIWLEQLSYMGIMMGSIIFLNLISTWEILYGEQWMIATT